MTQRARTLRQDNYESALIGNVQQQRGGGVGFDVLYARGGLYAKVIDMPADKAVSRGVRIQGDVDSQAANELDRLKALPLLANALRWSRLSGGAVIAILADDGRWNTPLNPADIGEIAELKVFPRTAVSATERRYTDLTQSNFGEPEFYNIRARRATFQVHESRLIFVAGDPLPEGELTQDMPWVGRGVAEATYPAIARYHDALEISKKILFRKQQPVYKMNGLAELITQKMEWAVQTRIGLVDKVRGVLNTVAIDATDDYAIHDMDLGGIKDLLGEYQVDVSSECGIAVTILFGRSPGGLNATGDADFDGYHEMVQGIQTNRATPALERLVALIYAQKKITGAPENWSIVWPPLESPTEKEQADVRKTNADALSVEMSALNTVLGTGAVSEQQALEWLTESEYFGLAPEGDGRAGAVDYAQ